jgi:NADPH:quinone reductase-like Zn-dependent oxidoreductase
MGAEVTAVDSTIKEDLIRRMGADHFIDYTKETFATMGRSYDVIFDMVAGSSYAANIRTLNPNGRYLTANPRFSVMLRSVLTSRFSDKTVKFAFAQESREELSALKQMIEDGKIKSIVDRVYPMDQAGNLFLHDLADTVTFSPSEPQRCTDQ